MNTTETVYDSISADTIEVGDQIIIDNEPIEVRSISETEDPDEIVIRGYSHDTGDVEQFSLYADDYYDLWSI